MGTSPHAQPSAQAASSIDFGDPAATAFARTIADQLRTAPQARKPHRFPTGLSVHYIGPVVSYFENGGYTVERSPSGLVVSNDPE